MPVYACVCLLRWGTFGCPVCTRLVNCITHTQLYSTSTPQNTPLAQTFLESLPPKMTDVPQLQDVHGRGIVISGGPSVFNSMVLVIRMLRALGCKLPIEVWHFAEELNTFQLRKLGSLGVSIRNIGLDSNFRAVQLNHSMAKPYDVKSAAMLNSAFEEVLWLDADTVPTRDPTYLFDTPEFKETGMLAWPDFWSADPRCMIVYLDVTLLHGGALCALLLGSPHGGGV